MIDWKLSKELGYLGKTGGDGRKKIKWIKER
jgi:hypothetical protein